ncbi:hypothetical protein KP509_21G042900 [Ceratopteris richardii]|uniref:Beta-glucosidase n=1 Tax=Ceratopteris richardii TaxID=49495 RepID=A0A8T2S9B8_CERRI|nr:hypothetical protein KP509_21G042900 [Ceratopteris richardii]
MANCLGICTVGALAALLIYAAACSILLPYVLRPPRLLPLEHLASASEDAILADFFERDGSRFFFGVATAPAHVEDDLNDSWVEFARREDRPVAAWRDVPSPGLRLRFWSDPETELDLVQEMGVTVLRLGVDWGRLIPSEPLRGVAAAVDPAAVDGYLHILRSARNRGLRTMVTLFHHSLPRWALGYGGWTDSRTISYFREFAAFCRESFGHLVDYWVTFNEPHIFALFSHCLGTWPPGRRPSFLGATFCFSRFGSYGRAMNNIVEAHKAAYAALHVTGRGDYDSPVGVAHHVGVIRPYSLMDVPLVIVARWLMQYSWIDLIQEHLDFCGLNFYGQEVLSFAGLMLDEDEEYSEAGRGVYPDGLYEVLLAFHNRYKNPRTGQPPFRYIITENGIADDRDVIRRPYLVEHLLAVSAARRAGVPVDGYLHWTISDNWEWSDGYCPKFGLVSVDRIHNLTRHHRPSFYLYKQIAESGIVSKAQRHAAWSALQRELGEGGLRPFCRKTDRFGRMWAEGLDAPILRPISERNWRLGHYVINGMLKYVVRCAEVAAMRLNDAVELLTQLSGNWASRQERGGEEL